MSQTPTPEEITVRLHRAMDAASGLTPEDIAPELIQDLEALGAALGARREFTDHLWEDAAGA
jgi:hypothetical protein